MMIVHPGVQVPTDKLWPIFSYMIDLSRTLWTAIACKLSSLVFKYTCFLPTRYRNLWRMYIHRHFTGKTNSLPEFRGRSLYVHAPQRKFYNFQLGKQTHFLSFEDVPCVTYSPVKALVVILSIFLISDFYQPGLVSITTSQPSHNVEKHLHLRMVWPTFHSPFISAFWQYKLSQ